MNRDEAIKALNALPEHDAEAAHVDADNILTNFLRYIGYEDVADAFDDACSRIGFWYA